MNVDDIAAKAIEIADPQKRDHYLASACGGDPQLRHKVDSLLAALKASASESFLSASLFKDSAVGPGEQSSRFELRSKHAVGGLGEVYVAWDRELAREVALKQMRPEWAGNADAAARFRREAEITGYLEHPGIVPIYSLGDQQDGRPFYAMQFIRGRTLREVVHEQTPPTSPAIANHSHNADRWYRPESLRRVLNHFVDVCQTIDYAHSKQVVHRDLKPDNIMLGAYGQTLVVDWGLAKRLDSNSRSRLDSSGSSDVGGDPLDPSASLTSQHDSSVDETRQGTTLGTPRFMSPEQASGDINRIGPAADIYCLGATLYFILTGRAPHRGEADLQSTLRRIVSGEFDSPRKIQSKIPPPLSAIVIKAMATEIGDRYQSAGQLADDVNRYLGDSPVSVFRDPPLERCLRWCRKNRAITASTVVGLMLVMIGTAIGIFVWQSINRRESEIARQRQADRRAIEFEKQTRRLEARSAADAALLRADVAIGESRFVDAVALVSVAVDQLADIPSMSTDRDQLIQKRSRLQRLGRFESLKNAGKDLDHLARDTEAAVLLQESLQQLGVWKSNAWWNELPDEDLSDRQRYQLQWQVYRILTALSSLYVTKMVTAMGGQSDGGTPSALRMLRSYLSTNIGKREAQAVVELTNRIEQFRPGQAAKWLGSIARFRLDGRRRIEPKDLGPPSNPADGQSLAIFSLIASVDPEYRVWFENYGDTFMAAGDEDPAHRARLVALETLRRVSDAAANDYWIRLTLAQTYFEIARYAESIGDDRSAIEHFELSRAEYGRCIAIRSEHPFAHADRSTVALRQARLLLSGDQLTDNDRRRADELLRLSFADASQAQRLSPNSHWVYWHVGATAAQLGQNEAATDAFFTAVELGFEVQNTLDAPIVQLDDLRGRSQAIEFAYQNADSLQSAGSPDRLAGRRAALIASLEYSRGELDTAQRWAELAVRLDPSNGRARRIAGWCALHSQSWTQAQDHFKSAVTQSPNDAISLIGAARVAEQDPFIDLDRCDRLLKRAVAAAISTRHRSAAWFALAQHAVRQGNFDDAFQSIQSARRLDPACDVNQFLTLSRSEARRLLLLHRSESDEKRKQSYIETIKSLKQFRDRVSVLPTAAVNQIIESANDLPPSVLPLLGGGFQLPLELNWQIQSVSNLQERSDQEGGGSPPWSVQEFTDVREGDRCLVIRRIEQDQATTSWRLVQRVPATSGQTYRIAASVKSLPAGSRSVTLVIRHSDTDRLRIPLVSTSNQWDRLVGEVSLPRSERKIEPIDVVLEIEDPGSATVWVDNIELTCGETSPQGIE